MWEGRGVFLWNDADAGASRFFLRQQSCANCGSPATTARRTLDESSGHLFLCQTCWSPSRQYRAIRSQPRITRRLPRGRRA